APMNLDGVRVRADGRSFAVVGVVPRAIDVFEEQRWYAGPIVRPAPRSASAEDVTRSNVTLLARSTRAIGRDELKRVMQPIGEKLSATHGARAKPLRALAYSLSAASAITSFNTDNFTNRGDNVGRMSLGGLNRALMGAIVLIIVIACANVSALMLARSVARRRDQALMLALGAPRRTVINEVAGEVAIIGVTGAVAGLLVADLSMRLLVYLTPPEIGWLGFRQPHWNVWVFAALLLVTLAVIAAASLLPAGFVSGIAPVEQLKDNSGTTTGRPRRRFQILVVGELALSMILLFGSVLVARSADRVGTYDFGYDARGVTAVDMSVHITEHPTDARVGPNGRATRIAEITPATLDDIVGRTRAVSGVTGAAWVIESQIRNVVADGSAGAASVARPQGFSIGAGFLSTLGLRVLAGRDFVETDRVGDGAVILDDLAAARLFADGRGVGRRVRIGVDPHSPWLLVVGIVQHAMHELVADPAVPQAPAVYRSVPSDWGSVSIVYRAAPKAKPAAKVAAVVSDLLPGSASFTTSKWLKYYEQFMLTRRFTAGLFLALSFASLLLAAAGLFGVLSYAVSQRMREFAVRVALGATRQNVVGLVAREGFIMVLGGTAVGAFVSMYAAFSLWEWLWGIYPVDAPSLIICEAALIGVALVGGVLPALRATRANPVEVMRAT
ncbi:MAG TPA: FtsX-like permease family protein, partial [Gemmatimonadaceae bacterium]|nr:FtsX-like permease family protein [Gemmatimonadaceae bacterium]